MGKEGQSIILVIVLLATLIVFVAITVDLGRAYMMRRQMQNAADAGALAGAQEICAGHTRRQAMSRAIDFAQRNEAEEVEVAINGKTARVKTEITLDTFFAKLVGVPQIVVGAEAEATCVGNEVKLTK